jgi:hypothetical protein
MAYFVFICVCVCVCVCEVSVQLYSFVCEYSVFPVSFVDKIILSLLDGFGTLVEN